MKKIAIITFHAAHNYGSMLQAYALQSILKSMDCCVEIINYRPLAQKNLYALVPQKVTWKKKLKSLMRVLLYPSVIKKYQKFESFLENYLNTTPAYGSVNELKENCSKFDIYISGSDQIWNSEIDDFSDVYLLSFVEEQRRISYAASFGPVGMIVPANKRLLQKELKNYDAISVREEKSADLVYDLIATQVPIMPDPTLLLLQEQWDAILPKDYVVPNQEYILLYSLCDEKELDDITDMLSKKLNLPVVITKYSSGSKFFTYFKYERKTTCGPREFLLLLKNAKFVLSSSFHGTLFSILYQKPFFSYKGASDSRISTLLKKTCLLDRAVTVENIEDRILQAYQIDFTDSAIAIQKEREKALLFLKEALGVQ